MDNYYTFPEETLMLTRLAAAREVRALVENQHDKAAFLLDIERSQVIEPANTRLLGYPCFTFEHFKSLHINDLYKLFDEQYSKAGLKIVSEGKEGIENCSFKIIQPIDTGPFCPTKEDQMLVQRISRLRKIKDGNREFDALLIVYQRLQAYRGRPIEFLPEFRKADGSLWEKGSRELQYRAWFGIVNDKKFPIKGITVDICSYKADGRSDEFIMEALNISKTQLQDHLKYMKRKNGEHFLANSSYNDIIQFFRNCQFI